MKYADLKLNGNQKDYISLSKMLGKKIKDITGSLSDEYSEPVFQPFRIVFEDGTEIGVEGEHDFPYLTALKSHPCPPLDDEYAMLALWEEYLAEED